MKPVVEEPIPAPAEEPVEFVMEVQEREILGLDPRTYSPTANKQELPEERIDLLPTKQEKQLVLGLDPRTYSPNP